MIVLAEKDHSFTMTDMNPIRTSRYKMPCLNKVQVNEISFPTRHENAEDRDNFKFVVLAGKHLKKITLSVARGDIF